MNEKFPQDSTCCEKHDGQPMGISITSGPITGPPQQDEACCGAPAGPPSSPLEKPGYALLDFVDAFVQTAAGPVPRVKTALQWPDYAGAVKARLGINRSQYKIAPGLYCIGTPDSQSPVLVTANYKLTFDHLRNALSSVSAWILVLDTRGINVWCAAGKDLFSTEEVVRRVNRSEVKKVVAHNRLILPQLAATGVAAHEVRKQSGFKVIYGPVRCKDLPKFITNDFEPELSMRRVTFNTMDRVILTPVELSHLPKPSLWILLAVFLISGIGTHVFSFSAAWLRGLILAAAYAAAILAGAVATPALLPWIPGRSFALKGAITGVLSAIGIVALFRSDLHLLSALALILWTTAISSYLAMNFTGSTPYTSPSGVEKEMRKAIPMQAAALLVSIVAWVASAFAG
jgi:hypothetical protein